MLLLYSLLPFIVFLFFLFVLRQNTTISLLAAAISTIAIAYGIWGFDQFRIKDGTIKTNILDGFFSSFLGFSIALSMAGAFDVTLIIFSALLLFKVIERSGGMHYLDDALTKLTHDPVYLGILVGFAIAGFFEAVAGFGTVQAIIAPLLLAIGFHPFTAVLISLVGDSTGASFGAFGTPAAKGFELITLTMFGGSLEKLMQVTELVARYHFIPSLIIPLAIAVIVLREKKKLDIRTLLKYAPFIIFSWLSFSIPFYLVASYQGFVMPTFIASLVSLIAMIVAIKLRVFRPVLETNEKFSNPYKHGEIHFGKDIDKLIPFVLYMMLGIILLLSTSRYFRLQLGFAEQAFGFQIPIETAIGTKTAAESMNYNPLFYPGPYILLVAMAAMAIYWKNTLRERKKIFVPLAGKSAKVFLTLFLGLLMSFVLRYSNENINNMPGMLNTMAKEISGALQSVQLPYELGVPFIGMLGAIISGSVTFSNILLTGIHLETAKLLGLGETKILALQMIGASVGVMTCIIHIFTAIQAAYHDKDEKRIAELEARALKNTAVVAVAYIIVALAVAALI